MGQRLVITITKNEEAIAAIYYHWSAYTQSALQETKEVIDCIYNHKDETQDEMLLRLIKCIEENGGGITSSNGERYYVQSLYPNEHFVTENYDRCNGLIALSKQGIEELQKWSEGDVFINLDTDQVDFCVYSGYESIEEYIEERKSWDDEFDKEEMKFISKYDDCLGHFDVHDIDHILDIVNDTNQHVIKCGDEICEIIE